MTCPRGPAPLTARTSWPICLGPRGIRPSHLPILGTRGLSLFFQQGGGLARRLAPAPPQHTGTWLLGSSSWAVTGLAAPAGGCAWFILSVLFEVHQIKGSKITDVDEVGLDSDGICVSERGPGELPAARGELSVLKPGQGTKDKNCQVKVHGAKLGMLLMPFCSRCFGEGSSVQPPLQRPPSQCPGEAQQLKHALTRQSPVPHATRQLGLAEHAEPARAVTTMGEAPPSPWAGPRQGWLLSIQLTCG